MKEPERILLVEDDADMRASCRQVLESVGYHTMEAGSAKDAEPILLRQELDLVITDLRMPNGGGEEVLRIVKSLGLDTPVLVITAYPSVESAVEAFRGGVSDYLLKPFTDDELVDAIDRALGTRRAGDRAALQRRMGSTAPDMPEMVGSSAAFKAMLATIRRVAPLDGNVLIHGETGSGKELVARSIHRFSRCSDGPFTVVNCAAIPETLLEAELFGYEKGAFTGAATAKPGLFEQANRGTLFLDEVAELSAAAQAKLLRAIEDKAVRRVGSVQPRPVETRIITATHKDLRQEVQAGLFREDLMYRLAVLEVNVPPLRERPQDIPQLALFFMDRLSERGERRVVGFSEEALERLMRHPWPGNVRELQNAVHKAYASSDGAVIGVDDLMLGGVVLTETAGVAPERRSDAIEEFERSHVTQALQAHDGNVTQTAKAMGVHRTTLQRLMKRLEIRPEEYR